MDHETAIETLRAIAAAFDAHDLDAILPHFVDGDRGASEWRLTRTTTEGERLDLHGCDLWTFRGNRVVKKDSFWKLVTDT